AARSVGLAGAQALGDDRTEVVGDHLVERSRAVPEVRRREINHQLGRGRDRMNDLEVEDRLPLRFFRRSPAGVALDGSTESNDGSPNLEANLLRSLRFGRSSISGSSTVCPLPSMPASRRGLTL